MLKKSLFVGILLLGFGLFAWRLFPSVLAYIQPTQPLQMLGRAPNSAQTTTITETHGAKSAQELGIKAGVYDVTIASSTVANFSALLGNQRGDRYLGYALSASDSLNVGPKEKLILKPAQFKKLKAKQGRYQIDHPGNYVVGRQIPNGRYHVTYHLQPAPQKSGHKYEPSSITVNSRFLNGDGGGNGGLGTGILDSSLGRASHELLLEKDRLLSIDFTWLAPGSYVTLTRIQSH